MAQSRVERSQRDAHQEESHRLQETGQVSVRPSVTAPHSKEQNANAELNRKERIFTVKIPNDKEFETFTLSNGITEVETLRNEVVVIWNWNDDSRN